MKKTMFMLILFTMVIAFAACKKEAARLAYPETKKVDQVDDYFGTKVADPYRWLEDDNAEDVKAWVEAQNKVTFGYLDTIPYRPKIKARLTEIFNYPRYSSPFRVGESLLLHQERRSPEPVGLSTSRRGSTARPRSSSTRTRCRRTGRSGSGCSGPRSTTSTWPSAAARPAPTGPRSGSWTSPPSRSSRTASSGSSSPARPGRATASITAATQARARRGAQGQERVPEGLLPQARRPAGEGRARLGGQGTPPALRRRRDDRRRRVADPRLIRGHERHRRSG